MVWLASSLLIRAYREHEAARNSTSHSLAVNGKKMAIKSGLIEMLVSYSHENPMASDTAEGIAEWWVKEPLKEVLPALESLVEHGIWKKVRLEDRVLYCPVENSGSRFHNGKGARLQPPQGRHHNREGSR
jgi:hypothetical protein